MNKPVLTIVIGFLVCFGIIALYIINYNKEYFISNSVQDIETALEERMGTDITVRVSTVTDDKLHFVFTIGETIGSGELSLGWNNKYKIEYFGHGTNWIRDRIIETKSEKFLKLAGRNNENIGSIRAFIDDEEYNVNIPDEEYYVLMTPVKETEREFTSAMIVYDREGKEMERINLSSE